MKLSELTIADLKAGLDYIAQQKQERIILLKEEDLSTKDDEGLNSLGQIEFDFSREIDNRIFNFKRDYKKS